jgi:hypothetical protein
MINQKPPISENGWEGENMKEGQVSITGTPITKREINAGLKDLNQEELDDLLILLRYTES